MDGLIDQARSQLWGVVNALDGATLHGERPTLEIALYEYGNSELPVEGGFIRQVSAFTPELDRVSEALFALDTIGGSEHAGQAIARTLDELPWTGEGLEVIYIAGNEEFDQGPVDWRAAIERARARGIVVNTVDCTEGQPDSGWLEAAALAGGRFLQIDQSAVAEHIPAPQDERIARLGELLNRTYVGYGRDGEWGMSNQMAQDANSARFGSASSIARAITKSSSSYHNPSWDLVDAIDTETITLDELDRDSLPAEIRHLSDTALRGWLADKRQARSDIQAELAQLAEARAAHVAAVRAERDRGAERLDTAIVRSIVEQAREVGFTIEPAP
ncbi:MAG: VWA domain-containing protein [Myxococcales bacterium]|nr:VWA domain-containing protein [Myxococcales bacterium]